MADRAIKIALILSAIDRASSVINKANKNAKAAFSFGKTSAIAGATFAAPIIYATNKAIEFEDKMADVAKVYNTKIGDSSFMQLGEQAKDLSEYLSKSAEESAALMASLGQGGVDQSDLQKVSRTAGEMAVAFDLTADIAGDRYTKLKNALNSSWSETAKIGDAINFLSDKQASKASEILEFMAAGGAGVAKTSKTAGKDLAAMGSYLISVGKSGAESSTIMERFYKGIMKNAGTRSMFMKAGQGAEGFMKVLEKGASIKDANKQFIFFKQFGEYGSEIQAMAGNLNQVRDSIQSVAEETTFANSINKEFINRNSTTKGRIGKSWAEFSRIILDFGQNGLPIIIDLLNNIKPIVKSVGDFMRNNKGLSATLFEVVAGAAALSFGISALSFVFGGVWKVISITTSAYRLLKGAQLAYHTAMLAGTGVTGGFKAAMAALNLTLLANPIVLIVLAVVALIAGLVLAYYKCEKFRAIMDGVFEVGKLLFGVFAALGKIIKATFTFDFKLLKSGLTDMGNLALKIKNGGIGKAFNKGYDDSLKASAIAKKAEKANGGSSDSIMPNIGAIPSAAPSPSSVSNAAASPSINFSPVINITGGATKADGVAISKQIKDQFQKLMREYESKQKRVAY